MNTRFIVRMTLPSAAISLLLLALGTGAAWHVHQLQKNISHLLAQDVLSVRAAEEVEIGIRQVQAQLHHFLITGDRKHLETVPALRQETDRWLAEAQRLAVTPHEREQIAQVRTGYDRCFEEFERLSHLGPGASTPQELRELVENLITKEILPPAHRYLDVNEEAVDQSSRENQLLAKRLELALLLLGTSGAVAGLLTGYGIARGISRSIVQLSVPIRDAAGKLNQVVGPVTFLAGASFQEMEELLRRIAAQVGTVVERLQQSQREVLRAEQLAAVGQLAAGMAHELRNPLMAMKILVQSAAASDPRPSLGNRDLVVLEEEIIRLEGAIRAFLDFARPPQMEKRAIEVGPVVQQTVNLISGRAGQQGVQIQCAMPRQPLVIEADLGQLRQVLLNLLLNALDAVPGGGTVQLRIAADQDSSPAGEPRDDGLQIGDFHPPSKPSALEGIAGWLTLQVADNGCGLPAHLGDRIFEPFVSTKETGTGLCLSICKRIVEAHGGTILAADQPTGGARFTIRLPLQKDDRPSGSGRPVAGLVKN